MSCSGVSVEKAYQELYQFCWRMGGVKSFEEAVLQWDLQDNPQLSKVELAKLEQRCKWLGLPQR